MPGMGFQKKNGTGTISLIGPSYTTNRSQWENMTFDGNGIGVNGNDT